MNIAFLNELRRVEIKDILEKHSNLIEGKRVLEIGGGTGEQAEYLANVASEVISLEIAESNYRESANRRIVIYDGHHVPFPGDSFDVVYSSNVLEHIAHRDAFQKEIMRVLKPGGYAIHSMPTHWWKLRDIAQNTVLLFPRVLMMIYRQVWGFKQNRTRSILEVLVGERHGEFGNTITEIYHFMPRIWLGHFSRLGWRLVQNHSGGLFYTSRTLLATNMSWYLRRLLAYFFGSSIHIYLLQNKS